MEDEFKIMVSGIELTMSNPNQIINMGGPYLCSLYFDGTLISSNCLFNNYIYKEDQQAIYFVKGHCSKQWFFTINYFLLSDKKVFEFSKTFRVVYIKQFISTETLEIYHALHDKMPELRDKFDITGEPGTWVYHGYVIVTNRNKNQYTLYIDSSYTDVIKPLESKTIELVNGSHFLEAVQDDGYHFFATKNRTSITIQQSHETKTWNF